MLLNIDIKKITPYFNKIRPYLKLISITATLMTVFAVSLTLMIGNHSAIDTAKNPEDGVSYETSDLFLESEALMLDPTVESYGLYIDGTFIASCISEDSVKDALDEALASKSKALGAGDNAEFINDFEIVKNYFNRSTLVSGTQLAKMLGCAEDGYLFEIESVNGVVDLELNLSYNKIFSKTSELEYETIYLDNDGKSKKYTKVLVDGETGSKTDYYETVYLNDKIVSYNLVKTVVLKEPVTEVIERGVMTSSSMATASLKIFSVPIYGYVTSQFGYRDIGQGWKLHDAIDISEPGMKGREVVAAGDGVVINKYYSWGYGNRIEIEHPNGMITTYSHLSKYLVEEGDVVKEGEPIGIVGDTGNATGIHLHFELIIDGEKVSPLPYLKEELVIY